MSNNLFADKEVSGCGKGRGLLRYGSRCAFVDKLALGGGARPVEWVSAGWKSSSEDAAEAGTKAEPNTPESEPNTLESCAFLTQSSLDMFIDANSSELNSIDSLTNRVQRALVIPTSSSSGVDYSRVVVPNDRTPEACIRPLFVQTDPDSIPVHKQVSEQPNSGSQTSNLFHSKSTARSPDSQSHYFKARHSPSMPMPSAAGPTDSQAHCFQSKPEAALFTTPGKMPDVMSAHQCPSVSSTPVKQQMSADQLDRSFFDMNLPWMMRGNTPNMMQLPNNLVLSAGPMIPLDVNHNMLPQRQMMVPITVAQYQALLNNNQQQPSLFSRQVLPLASMLAHPPPPLHLPVFQQPPVTPVMFANAAGNVSSIPLPCQPINISSPPNTPVETEPRASIGNRSPSINIPPPIVTDTGRELVTSPTTDACTSPRQPSPPIQSPVQKQTVTAVEASPLSALAKVFVPKVFQQEEVKSATQNAASPNVIEDVRRLLCFLENSNLYDRTFDIVKLQLCKLLSEMDSAASLRPVVEEIFQKSVNEERFCYAGARICAFLACNLTQEFNSFWSLLLERCYVDFVPHRELILSPERRPHLCNFALFVAELMLAHRSATGVTYSVFPLFLTEMMLTFLSTGDTECYIYVVRILKLSGFVLDKTEYHASVDKVIEQMRLSIVNSAFNKSIRGLMLSVLEQRASLWAGSEEPIVEHEDAEFDVSMNGVENYGLSDYSFVDENGELQYGDVGEHVPLSFSGTPDGKMFEEGYGDYWGADSSSFDQDFEGLDDFDDGMDSEIDEAYEQFLQESANVVRNGH